MSFQIRNARPEDGQVIATILSDFIDETPWMVRIHTREEDRQFGANLIEKTDVWVADHGGVLGFIACRNNTVEALYVHTDHRGQGVGTELLKMAMNRFDDLGLWTFQANAGARRFYARNGFVEGEMTDGERNDENLPDVHMRWTGKAT